MAGLQTLALEGVWLLGALAIVYFAGVFTSQWVKDKLTGVPSGLRSALRANESAALTALKNAESKLIADVAGLLQRGAAQVQAAKPAAAPAVAAAPPAPAVIEPPKVNL